MENRYDQGTGQFSVYCSIRAWKISVMMPLGYRICGRKQEKLCRMKDLFKNQVLCVTKC